MNNIKGYDEFVNEEFNFKHAKSRIKIEITSLQAKAFLYGLKGVLFWNKTAMEATNVMGKFFQKFKEFRIFMLKYDDELERITENGSDEELKEFINTISIDYESKFESPFIDDLKVFLGKVLNSSKAKKVTASSNPKSKDVKNINNLRRVFNIISDQEVREEDPYGEEEWNDDNKNTFELYDILEDGRRMTPEDYLKHIKGLVLNKHISFQEDKNDLLIAQFKTKLLVKDVKLKEPEWIRFGVIFIDDKGKEFYPSPYEKINILD